MRAFAILNMKAAVDDEVRSAIEGLRQAGHALHVRVVWEAENFTRALEDAAAAGAQRLLVAGGDGSLNVAASHIIEHGLDCAVCPLPFGTANDFATASGVHPDIAAAFEHALAAEPTLIDYGRANGRVFINVATAAIAAASTAETDPTVKSILGGLAYWYTGITKLMSDPVEATITADDWTWSGKLLGLSVANSELAGGGFKVGPKAKLDDGLLDVLIVPDLTVPGRSLLAAETFRDDWAETSEAVVYRQTAALRVEFAESVPFNVDGEPFQETAVDFDVVSLGLAVVAPDLSLDAD